MMLAGKKTGQSVNPKNRFTQGPAASLSPGMKQGDMQ